MQRKDYNALGLLYLIVLLIYYPLFYTDYIYMDEALEIWQLKPDSNFIMFLDDGRALTEWLQRPIFTRIDTIHEITYVRIISLLGWMACIPIWYVIIKRIMVNMQAYEYLPFFACLYLVTSLPFTVSVQWATCMQFFIGQTCGLLSGAVIYKGIRFRENKMRIAPVAAGAALLLGVASMFFYQNAVGCFVIPFLLHFINPKTAHKNKVLITGFVVYMLIYGVYYILYKISLKVYEIPVIERNNIHIDVVDKLKWFLARPLERSFRFSVMTHEDSTVSKFYYPLMLLAWAWLAFKRFGRANWPKALIYLALTVGIFFISYLPNLIIKENFASNRTLLALNMCVWLVVAEMFLFFVRDKILLQLSGIAVAVVFVIAARNNFRREFLHPIQQETAALQDYFHRHYHNGIRAIYFIRSPEDLFVKKYNVYESMDEFGVPQTFWPWVPDALSRQLAYEVNHDRKLTLQLAVRQWADRSAFERSGAVVDKTVLIVDAQEIMKDVKP